MIPLHLLTDEDLELLYEQADEGICSNNPILVKILKKRKDVATIDVVNIDGKLFSIEELKEIITKAKKYDTIKKICK